MTKKREPRERGTFGLYAKNFPASVRSRVDQDYIEELSPAEKQWLADFNDMFYGADFRDKPDEWSTAEKRKAYIDKNTANTDLYAQAEAMFSGVGGRHNGIDSIDDHPGVAGTHDQDAGPTPEYLNSPEYKKALAEYRAHLAPGRKPVKPKNTPEMKAARERLQKVIDGKPEEG